MKNKGLAKRDLFATDQILRQVAPMPVQPIDKNTGLVGGFFQNWKLEQRAKSTGFIRQIAENQAATTQAYASSMMTMMTFPKQVQHLVNMMELEEQEKMEDIITKRFKNSQLNIELKKSTFEFRQMLKDNGEDEEE